MPTLEELQERAAQVKERAAKKKPLEREVEGPVKDYARSKRFYVRKFKSVNNRAVPDDIFSTPEGVVFFIEFKRPGKKATPDQADEHKIMRAHGLKVHVIDNVAEGKRLIDEYANGPDADPFA